MNPVISIVMPAYNASEHLSEAIESVHRQTFDAWELVVVDDGSTDGTADIVRDWSVRDPRVRLLQQPNRGVSAARDAGLRAAVGTWVAFVDSDDWIDPAYLKKMYAPLRNGGLDGTFCAAADVVESGKWGKIWRPVPRADFFPTMAVDCPIAVHCALLRRQLVLDVGGWDHALETCEDWDLWQRIARTKGRFRNLDAVLAFIRLRQGSLSRSYPARIARDGRVVLARGRARDPRVPDPDPKWAEGYAVDSGSRIAEHMIWAAGIDIAEGGDGQAIIDGIDNLSAAQIEPQDLALTLYDAISHTAGEVGMDWTPFLPKIEALLDHLDEMLETPALRTRTLRALEGVAYHHAYLDAPVDFGSTRWMSLDLADPIDDVVVPEGILYLAVVMFVDGERIGIVQLDVRDGRVDRHRLARELAVRHGGAAVIRRLRQPGKGGFGIIGATVKTAFRRKSIRFALSLLQYRPATWIARLHRFGLVNGADLVTEGGILKLAPGPGPETATTGPGPAPVAVGSHRDPRDRSSGDPTADGYDEKTYWESVFSSENPWEYDNSYEQTKYAQTLALLGSRKISTALELACAEGFFTRYLAPRVDSLVATDISETAVERAAKACADFDNITFRQLDLIKDEIDGKYDLIVCSEVLYYFESRRTLATLAAKLGRHLNPGGVILMAHGLIAANAPEKTGFDWGHPFDARSIGRIFSEAPGLELVTEARSDLYHIQLLQASGAHGAKKATPEIVRIDRAEGLSYYVSSQIEWNGSAHHRMTEVTDHLPILLYHRVTDEPTHPSLEPYRMPLATFESHLKYLADNGFHSVSLDTWQQSRDEYSGLKGRPVVITFDDGYVDFHDHAWPLLQKYGFGATVFLVSGLVGKASEWDTRFGPPAPLMDWDSLRRLSAQGVRFGSHTVSHPFLTMLTPQEVAHEAATSKAEIEHRLGVPVSSIAYPYGEHNEIVERVFEDQGYTMGLTVNGRLSDVFDHHMQLGRMEFTPKNDVAFIDRTIRRTTPMNPIGRARYRAARAVRHLRYNVR